MKIEMMRINDKGIVGYMAILMLLSGLPYLSAAQDKTMIHVKTFDRQLNFMPNLEISIDGEDYFITDDKGLAYVEVIETHLPPRGIKIKNKDLEAESWNYSRGVLEIIIRKKSYQVITVVVKDRNNKPVKGLKVSFNAPKPVTAITNTAGEFQMPVPIHEDLNSTNLFSIVGYEINDKKFNGTRGNFQVTQITPRQTRVNLKEANDDGSGPFNLQYLDSIRSLTVFYAFIKNLEMQQLDDLVKQHIDLKFYQLVNQLEDSLNLKAPKTIVGKITDSSLVKDDVLFLIDQAFREEKNLDDVKQEFNQKIDLINKKLTDGGKNLTDAERKRILSDLERLAKILIANEQKFFRNQADYKAILGSLKSGLLDIKDLEDQLTYSEQQRLEEQQAFREKIFIVFLVLAGLGLLTILSIYLARKFKKQKNELAKANAEVERINQHLEELVSRKTASLKKANQELDTFLYKSSHDLKRPLTSIMGLSNIAKLTLGPESWELFEKASETAIDMDKMLRKLMMVNQINHPLDYDSIDFSEKIKKVRGDFEDFIKEHKISFNFEVCKESNFESFPVLVEIILRNLVENALFYSTLKARNQPEVGVRVSRENSHINICVHDNGSGIKPDVQPQVWDMFYVGNEKSRGNGLGLYIAQKAASVLKGSISFTTEEDTFTEFKVTLPVVPGTNGASNPPQHR